jgi:YHS domain-containing protein
MIVDPVCGEELDHFEYPDREEYNGRIYFFGSLECAQKFREDPGKYAAGHEDLGEPIPEYTHRGEHEGS